MKAFPTTRNSQDGVWYTEDGMDLRDYFAGKAMQGYISSGRTNLDLLDFEERPNQIAKTCYVIADAMMKSRTK